MILKLFTWMNRLDIWITIIQKIQSFVEFWPLKAEFLLKKSSYSGAYLDWSVRKVCVCGLWGKNGLHRAGGPWIEKLKSSAIAFSFAWFFLSFFNDHFILFILANVAANHKTTTTGSDMLNKIVGVLIAIQFCSNFPHKYTTFISTIKLASK